MVIKKSIVSLPSQFTQSLINPENWHLTIGFIGNASIQSQHCLIEQINKIHCQKFTLSFDRLAYLTQAKILYYGVNDQSDKTGLLTLVNACRNAQIYCGLETTRVEFLPHISIAKKILTEPARIMLASFEWSVREFTLVESQITAHGSHYKIKHRVVLQN